MTDDDPYGQQPGQGDPSYGQQPQGDNPSGQPDAYAPPAQPYGPPYGQATPPPPYGQPYGPQPYGQPYGPPAPGSYPGYPGYSGPPAYTGPSGYPGYVRQPEDGGAQAAMIVGIVSVGLGLLCGLGFIGSPVAWYLGARSKRRIDASNGQLGGRGSAQAGFVLGIIGTIVLVLVILAVIALIVLLVSTSSWEDNGSIGTNA